MNKNRTKTAVCTTFSGMIILTSGAEMEEQAIPADTELLSNTTFVVFDTETTGYSRKNGRIIEIGAVKFRNGETLAAKSWLVNPRQRITFNAQRIHGISDEMLIGKPSFKEVFPKFCAFAKGSVLLAHNASFDVGFMKHEIERNDLSAPDNEVLDTLRLTRRWYPEFESHSLSNLVRRLNISNGTLHRALEDSDCTRKIFLQGLQTMPPDATLGDLKKLCGKVLTF